MGMQNEHKGRKMLNGYAESPLVVHYVRKKVNIALKSLGLTFE